MDDWRLRGDEDLLRNATVYRIRFPEFWERAYREKNSFYHMIRECANLYIEKTHQEEAFPEEKIRHLWHEHCFFCWEKATTDADGVFYCTEDMKFWICGKCFEDFKDRFKWVVRKGEELCEQELHCQYEIMIAEK